jgi:ABC transporter substrate binding protein
MAFLPNRGTPRIPQEGTGILVPRYRAAAGDFFSVAPWATGTRRNARSARSCGFCGRAGGDHSAFARTAAAGDARDPIQLGLVASLNRPGGNVTGVTQLNWEILPKKLELLHELLPTAGVISLLINPTDSVYAEMQSREALAAAHRLGLDLHVLNASTERDFDSVFADLIHLRAGGLVIGEDAFFNTTSNSSPR